MGDVVRCLCFFFVWFFLFFSRFKKRLFPFFKFMNDDVIFVTVEYYFDLELNSNIQGYFDRFQVNI